MASTDSPIPFPVGPIYEKLPEESAKQYGAFCQYRDLGPRRTIFNAATAFGITPSTANKWSHKYSWKDRAAAWDAHLDQVRRDEAVNDIVNMRERHANIALLVQEKVVNKLNAMTPVDVKNISNADLIRWLAQAASIEAGSRGVPVPPAPAPGSPRNPSAPESPPANVARVHETVVRTREEYAAARAAAEAAGKKILGGDS
jgi:hypothetical protein